MTERRYENTVNKFVSTEDILKRIPSVTYTKTDDIGSKRVMISLSQTLMWYSNGFAWVANDGNAVYIQSPDFVLTYSRQHEFKIEIFGVITTEEWVIITAVMTNMKQISEQSSGDKI